MRLNLNSLHPRFFAKPVNSLDSPDRRRGLARQSTPRPWYPDRARGIIQDFGIAIVPAAAFAHAIVNHRLALLNSLVHRFRRERRPDFLECRESVTRRFDPAE